MNDSAPSLLRNDIHFITVDYPQAADGVTRSYVALKQKSELCGLAARSRRIDFNDFAKFRGRISFEIGFCSHSLLGVGDDFEGDRLRWRFRRRNLISSFRSRYHYFFFSFPVAVVFFCEVFGVATNRILALFLLFRIRRDVTAGIRRENFFPDNLVDLVRVELLSKGAAGVPEADLSRARIESAVRIVMDDASAQQQAVVDVVLDVADVTVPHRVHGRRRRQLGRVPVLFGLFDGEPLQARLQNLPGVPFRPPFVAHAPGDEWRRPLLEGRPVLQVDHAPRIRRRKRAVAAAADEDLGGRNRLGASTAHIAFGQTTDSIASGSLYGSLKCRFG